MKNKLYIFGSSYAWYHNDDRTWPFQLAKGLDVEMANLGYPGHGVLQMFYYWQSVQAQMQPGDWNLIHWPRPDRSFFFKDMPNFSQESHGDSDKVLERVDKEVAEKIVGLRSKFSDYHKFLHVPDHQDWFMQCWIRWLDSKAKQLGTKTIIISENNDFLRLIDQDELENLLVLEKSILEISENESADEKIQKVFNSGFDPRANHLCISNHRVLTNKILEAVKIGKFENPNEGWMQQAVTRELLLDNEWCYNEFCYEKFSVPDFFEKNCFEEVLDFMHKM